MHLVNQAIIAGLRSFDSATVFNALVRHGGLPNEEYTDHTIRCLLPELGPVVGYAVTAEVTTNDPDTAALDWPDYYEVLEAAQGPLVAVLKDVDSRPGRGASFGDGMATVHKRLGVVGALVDGTVRDLVGIQRVGLPIWAWGSVPGHGVFNVTRINTPVTVGQLRVRPGDLLFADSDGCVRIPNEHAEEILRLAGEVRAMEAEIFAFYNSSEFSVAAMRARQ
ncbi:MAG: RraA family protein [Caldilineaceae bacterium]|nr:RraA family protein [Caldilineaceae bacterium]